MNSGVCGESILRQRIRTDTVTRMSRALLSSSWDADIAGCVSTSLGSAGRLDAQRAALLERCYRDVAGVTRELMAPRMTTSCAWNAGRPSCLRRVVSAGRSNRPLERVGMNPLRLTEAASAGRSTPNR